MWAAPVVADLLFDELVAYGGAAYAMHESCRAWRAATTNDHAWLHRLADFAHAPTFVRWLVEHRPRVAVALARDYFPVPPSATAFAAARPACTDACRFREWAFPQTVEQDRCEQCGFEGIEDADNRLRWLERQFLREHPNARIERRCKRCGREFTTNYAWPYEPSLDGGDRAWWTGGEATAVRARKRRCMCLKCARKHTRRVARLCKTCAVPFTTNGRVPVIEDDSKAAARADPVRGMRRAEGTRAHANVRGMRRRVRRAIRRRVVSEIRRARERSVALRQ